MANILDIIVENKRREVAAKAVLGAYDRVLVEAEKCQRPVVSMSRALAESETGIIAEFKRRSPSKGEIHGMASAAEVISAYAANGATACSVLTDTRFFGGSLDDLSIARSCTGIPLLRKEFVVDPRQIFEARCYGADAILLIASVLSFDEICRFTDIAHGLGLETLLELHNEAELDKFSPETDMVGVNNRNLTNFVTDTDTSLKLAQALPADVVKVAESGLTSIEEIKRLRSEGYRGFLMGERFMKYDDPANALKEFLNGTV
jgi:indole-3-glycerol phosphate synthase